MIFQGFIGPSFTHRNFSYSAQSTKNWLIEQGTPVGKSAAPFLFVPRRGLKLYKDDFTGVCRGGYSASNNKIYWAFGTNLYQHDSINWKIVYSAIPGDQSVKFSDNGTTLFFIANNTVFYMPFATEVVTAASGGAYSTSTTLAFLDSYIIFSRLNSNQFYWTDLSSTTANALNFASAESSPDKIVGIVSHNLELFVFGERTTEIWYNAGQADITFARRGNAVIETGCLSADSIAKIGTSLIWLSSDNRGGIQVSSLSGYSAQRISTYPLEQYWQGLSIETLKRAEGFTLQVDGHDLYILNIPGCTETFVFDITSGSWTTFTSSQENVINRYQAKNDVFYNGKHYAGDYNAGIIYTLESQQYTDNNNFIQFERTSPSLNNENKRIFFDQLRLDFFTGTNTSPVQVMVDWQDDGIWSNEIIQEFEPGDFSGYVELRRLGYGRNRVFRIRVTSDNYLSLSGASLDIRVAQH